MYVNRELAMYQIQTLNKLDPLHILATIWVNKNFIFGVGPVAFYLYPTVSRPTALVHSVKPELTE